MTRVVDFEGRRARRQQQKEAAADLRPTNVVQFPLDEIVEVLVAMSDPEFRSLSPEDFRSEVRRRLPGISDDQVRNALPATNGRLAELERQRRKIDYPLEKIASVIGAVVRSTRRYTTWPERQAEIRRRLPEITDGQIAEGLAVAQARHEARAAARKEQNALLEASTLRSVKLLGEFGITLGELGEVSKAAGDPPEDELRHLLEERFGPPRPFSLVEPVGNPGGGSMTRGTEIQRMTARERSDLTALIRKRERVMKAAVAERSAHLLADFEQQCASIYNYDDDAIWAQAFTAANEAVKVAQDIIAKRNAALGIPAEFGPSISMGWYERGRNAVAKRRAELRRVAMSRIAAIEKAAITQIERKSLEAQTEVLATGLESDGARAFLASLNDIDQLMPPLDAGEIDKIVDTKRSTESAYLPIVG